MKYKPNPVRLRIEMAIRVSVFVLGLIGLALLALPHVSSRYAGFVVVASVFSLIGAMPMIQQFLMPRMHRHFFDQTIEIEEDLLICTGPFPSATRFIPVSAVDAEHTIIAEKKALISYATPQGHQDTISIPLRLYDREVFEILLQTVPHKAVALSKTS